jgi:hypothetical protein
MLKYEKSLYNIRPGFQKPSVSDKGVQDVNPVPDLINMRTVSRDMVHIRAGVSQMKSAPFPRSTPTFERLAELDAKEGIKVQLGPKSQELFKKESIKIYKKLNDIGNLDSITDNQFSVMVSAIERFGISKNPKDEALPKMVDSTYYHKHTGKILMFLLANRTGKIAEEPNKVVIGIEGRPITFEQIKRSLQENTNRRLNLKTRTIVNDEFDNSSDESDKFNDLFDDMFDGISSDDDFDASV